MTPEQVTLVQESFEKVKPISDTAAELFYAKLFELDPDLQPLFASSDMKLQGNKLMTMIGTAVVGLSNIESIVGAVEELGKRHVAYGVKDADYDTVGAALLWTLEQGLGDEFTPEVKTAWSTVYVILANTMKTAAAKAA